MADSPAYTKVHGKIPDLLRKIRETGMPARVNLDWLKSIGFKSSNDRSLINVLKQVGFVDNSGAPTQAWKNYRGADHKRVLGRAIKQGYSELYATYPDAHNRDATELYHWFSMKTPAGKQVVDASVSTFKALAAQADLESADPESPLVEPHEPNVATGQIITPAVTQNPMSGTTTININVQLTLPETTNPAVYEAFFRSMRDHLLTDES